MLPAHLGNSHTYNSIDTVMVQEIVNYSEECSNSLQTAGQPPQRLKLKGSPVMLLWDLDQPQLFLITRHIIDATILSGYAKRAYAIIHYVLSTGLWKRRLYPLKKSKTPQKINSRYDCIRWQDFNFRLVGSLLSPLRYYYSLLHSDPKWLDRLLFTKLSLVMAHRPQVA